MARMNRVLEAFNAEGAALLGVVDGLAADDLARPTNCPPWNLAELVVHIAGSVRAGSFNPAPAAAVPRAVADYYRRPEWDTAEYRDQNVRTAQWQARRVLERMTVAECLADALRDTSSAMITDDLERIVEIDRIGPMRLTDWLATRVVALAAHGLDVAITLDSEPWTTPEAQAVLRPIFLSLLGRDLPANLDWSDQRLLATAAGRSSLTHREQAVLGPTSALFPLLS